MEIDVSSYSPKVLADRPIAFFEMTEVAGAAIVDSSPNARRGAIVGGVTLGAEGPIPGGKSLELDGSSGHVALEGSWASGGGELTIEVWVRGIRGGSEGQAIVSSTTTELVHLQMSEDPGYRNALYADNGDHMVPVLSPLPLEVWRHIAFIVRPGMVTIVEDGVVRSETAVTFTDLRPTSLLRIGCGWGGGRFFAGRIGPLAIYDRALSVAAIRGHLGLPTVDATIYAARVLGDQPIAYFPMGEVAGTAIADQSSHGRRGTLEGGVRVGAAGPIEGTKSLEFDGSGRVVLDGSWAGEGGELTVEVWVWSARGGPEGQAIVSAVGGEFVHLQMSDDPGYRNAIYTDAGYSLVPVLSPAPIGVWRHIVLIVRPGTVTIVEDGVVRSETACAFNEIVPSSIVHVGSGYGYGRFFAGRIGPLAIYARALTPAEIRAHLGFDEGSSDEVREEAAPGTYDEAVLADGPVAFFNWRSTEGGIARDVTDAARTGALHGAVTVTDAEGLVGLRCLELDGKTGEVRLDGEWGGGTELTVEAWICSGRSSWDTQAVVAAADEAFLFLHCNNDDEKKIRIFTTGADDEKVELPVVSTLPLDQWRHVVVAARSGSQRLYVDGVLITEESTSYGLLTPTKDLRIGAGYGGARHYQGKIGPVAIFDRQLAPENVMAHYRAATDGRGPTLYFGELCVLLLAEEGSTVFSASVDSVPITAILSALLGGVALPPEVPKVTLKNVEVSLDLSDGALKVSGDAVTFLRIEGVDLTATARLVYERGGGPNHPKKCAITLGALGPVEVVPGLSVGSVELAFAYQETEKTDEETKKKTIERSWAVGGGLSTSILGVSLALSAGYEVKDGKRKLTLFGQLGDSGRTLLDIFEVAAIKATQVILTLAKPVDADDDDDRLEVSLSVSSGVRFLDIVDVNMTLEIADEEKRRFLALTMDQASYFEIPIEVGSGLKIRISAPRIALTQKIDGDKKTYEIEAKVSLALLGLPEWVHRYACFPRKVTGELKGTKEGLILKATNILEPLDIALPNLDLGAGVVIETSKLGTTRLHLRELSAKILKKKPEGTLTVSLGLPAGVNRIFGVDENDQPRANIFRTFNPQQPLTSTIDFEIGVGTGADNKAKFILRLKNSPVTFLVIQDGVWYVDLGEFGAFEVDIPTFTSKDGGFAATGGLRVTRDFAIPLVHAKALLGLLGLGDVAARLPTKIPAMDVRLYDEEGKLAARKVVEYCASFASGVGLALPEGLLALLEPPLEAVAEFTERLPDAFKDYLSIEVPRTLSFDVVYRGETNFSINIWGDEDRPLRLFLPYWNMTPMFPLLIGVSMSRLSVGMLLGGNLVSLQTTATIDVFDPFTIAAGMVIPPNQWIPQGSAMLRQLVIEDLMMFVVTATKIPIPIPLFYEKLAFRVQGVEGIYIGAGAHFPMPQLGITEAVRMVSALLHFFKDPAARLPMIEASDVNTEIAVIAVGSALDVWAINSGGELLRRASDGSGTWSVIGTPAAPTHVSVGGDGTPWILADRIPYRREADGTWTSWAAQRFEHLDAASRDQVAAVDGEGVIFRYEPGPNAWAPVEGIAEHRVVRIATDATGAFWAIAEHRLPGAVTRGRFFWRSAEGPWNLDLNRTFDQIAIASLSHHAGVAPDGTIHVYAAGPGWQRIDDPLPQGTRAIQAAVSSEGDLWVVGQDNALFQRQGAAWHSRGKEQGALPQGLDLRFGIDDAMIRLPPYLGGSLLGKEGKLVELSAVRIISGILNTFKFGTFADLLNVVDLEYRKGQQELAFFFIRFTAQWLVSTPREFREGAAASIGVAGLDVNRYIGLLPDARDDDGIVVFLRGATEMPGVGHLESAFGLMLTPTGFVTGLRFAGTIAGFQDYEIAGRLEIDGEGPSFEIAGQAHLDQFGLRLFNAAGKIRIEAERFLLSGKLQLFPDGAPLQLVAAVSGRIDAQGVDLRGVASANAFAVGPIASSAVVLSNQGLVVDVRVFDQALAALTIGDLGDARGLDFAASFGPLATHHRLAIAKSGASGSYRVSATMGTIALLGDLAITPGAASGALTLDAFGRRVLSGTMSAGPSAFALAGRLQLFPEGSCVQLYADLNGRVDRSGITLSGQTAVNALAGPIFGSGRIEVSPTGLLMEVHALGQRVGMIQMADLGDTYRFEFAADLGGVASDHRILLSKDGRGGSYALSGGVGPFHFATAIAIGGPEMRGDVALDGFGQRLLSGQMIAEPGRLRVEGVGGFSLPGLSMVLDYAGEFGGGGLHLNAKGGASFAIGGLPFAGAEAGLKIAGAEFTVALKMWIGAIEVHGIASMRTFQGQPCFLAAWLEGPSPPFLGTGNCNRLIIYPDGGVRLDWHWMTWGEDGWPADLRPDGGPIAFAAGDEEAPEDLNAGIEALPTDAAIASLLRGAAAGEDAEARAKESLQALRGLGYQPLTIVRGGDGGATEIRLPLAADPADAGIAAEIQGALATEGPLAFGADLGDEAASRPRPRGLVLRSGGAEGPLAELELEGEGGAIQARFDADRPGAFREALGAALARSSSAE